MKLKLILQTTAASLITIKGDNMDVTGVDGQSVMHYKRQK